MHSARPAIAASVISPRVGRPDFTISSITNLHVPVLSHVLASGETRWASLTSANKALVRAASLVGPEAGAADDKAPVGIGLVNEQ
jgi:hypothetical protein